MLAAASAAALAGCAGGVRKGGLSLWAEDAAGDNAKYILPEFTRRSGVPVDLQWMSWTAARQKLFTAAVAGDLPDVLMASGPWMRELALLDAVTPLPEAAAALLHDQFPGSLPPGPAFAAPWMVDVNVQYYRRDLLARAGYDAPPPTWDEWRVMLHAIKRRTRAPFAVLMQLNWPEHLFNILAQAPEPLLRDDQCRGNFDAPGVRVALAFYKSLFDEELAPRVTGAQNPDPVAELARGWIATYGAGYWTRGELLRRSAEAPAALWATALLPGPDGPGRGVVEVSGLAMSRHARDRDRAWRLMAYLTDPDVQVRFFGLCGALPSRPSVWRTPRLADDPKMRAFADQLGRLRPQPHVPEWSRIVPQVQQVAERMARGELTVDAAAVLMNRTADRLLAKRRALLDRGRAA